MCCCGGKDVFVKHTCTLDGSCALLCSADPGSAGVVLNMHKVVCEQLSAHLLRCSLASLSPSLPQPINNTTANSPWLPLQAHVYMRLVCCLCQTQVNITDYALIQLCVLMHVRLRQPNLFCVCECVCVCVYVCVHVRFCAQYIMK